jgi:hypothetical protein
VGETVYRRGFGDEYAAPIIRVETTYSPDGKPHDTLYLLQQSVDGAMREYEHRAVDVVYAAGSASPLTA